MAITYVKTNWENDRTPLNATNMNHIEEGIEGAYDELALKANVADVYNKDEADALLDTKANADDVYTKQESYNKTKVDELLAEKQGTLTFDETPIEGSTNPVTSDGIYKAIDEATPHEGTITNDMLAGGITGDKLAQSTKDLFDAAGTATNEVSTHNVSITAHTDIRDEVALKANKTYVDTELEKKQDNLTFDNTPENGSTNPVTSDGIYDALAVKANAATVNEALALKADADSVYTKQETYTQSQVGTLLNNGINTHNTSNTAHADIRETLSQKANSADVYTKSETDTLLGTKQNTLTFDDTPTAGSTNPVTSEGIKSAIDSAVSSVYKYKGSVATYNDLPSTGLTVGDVYNVEDTGDNYAWDGTAWDKLSGIVDLSGYVPTSRTIAGLDLTQDRSAQDITDNLIFCNLTTDIDYIMGDNQ